MSLHVHSEYSALDGWSTVDEIGDRMVEIGCPFCGLTDHGIVTGHIDFDKAMRSRGLNPVFGAELYHGLDFSGAKKKERDQAHLIALAMTDEGLRNLWRLVNSTADRRKFHYVGRVSSEDLVKYKEGIMFTSACPLGLVAKGLLQGDNTHLNWYLNNFGDNFRLELTTYPGDADWSDEGEEPITPRLINELKVEVAEERGIPLTYGDDGHYAFPSQFKEHDMYLAAQTGQTIYTPVEERKMYHPPDAVCIKDEQMVRESLHYLPDSVVSEAIINSWEIGAEADAHLPDVERHMPTFIPSDCPWVGEDDPDDSTELFISLVEQGIERIYGGTEREAEAWEKTVKEVEVLVQDGLVDYFLLAWDLMQFCDKEGIDRGPGRGSSAGCIAAYALGITDVDPLHYELYFERFWNQGRTEGFPDIDSDFARSRREDIHEYLMKRWGEKQVCSIGTVVRMKPVAVIDKLKKPCGLSDDEEKEIKKIVKQTEKIAIHGYEQIGWNPELEPGKKYYVKKDVGDQIEKWVGNDKKRANFIRMCEAACSRASNYGVHPSGIVVSDIDLSGYAPAVLRGGKTEGIPATMFPMKIIEGFLKLVKLDVLGLKTLDMLADWKSQMSEKGIEINWSGMDLEEFPDEMWDLLDEGFVAGLFQIETKEGKRLTEELKPRSVDDLGVLVAINRPGPDSAEFVARKEGRSPIVYDHPILEPILSNTFGLFVYQEQIIRFMGDLGYSPNDGDAMRKVLGKKEPQKLDPIYYGEKDWKGKGFLQTAMDKGFTEETAKKVWDDIEDFASYSFNKSHAICYAVIALRCLIAKYYGPSEFYISCIRTVDKNKQAESTPQYIREARRKGINVLPPDIRYSKGEIAVHDGNIYFGFCDVKGVSSSGSYVEWLRDDKGIDINSLDTFVDALTEYNDEELKSKKQIIKDGGVPPENWKSPKQHLTSDKITYLYDVGAWDGMEQREINLSKKQKFEQDLLGVILTDNSKEILEANAEIVEDLAWQYEEAMKPWHEKEGDYDWTDEEGNEIPDKQRFIEYTLIGTIADIRLTRVKASGAGMGIVTIEHGRHELQFPVFSKRWKTYKFLFKPRATGVFVIRHTAPNEKRGEGYHFEEGYTLNDQ